MAKRQKQHNQGENSTKRGCNEKYNCAKSENVYVDVIVPVYNAAETIEETVSSALHQIIPLHLKNTLASYEIDVAICCYDDGSDDNSLSILNQIQQTLLFNRKEKVDFPLCHSPRILIGRSLDGSSRGAGYARNQAVSLRDKHMIFHTNSTNKSKHLHHFLCLLDSDDIMKPTRIAEQLCYFFSIPKQSDRDRTLLGTTFIRDPPDSTWHYSHWANQLTDERLMMEKFREVTILQPTWMMTKSRFHLLGGYVEAPRISSSSSNSNTTHMNSCNEEKLDKDMQKRTDENSHYRLIHPAFDTPQSLRLAEDLRFFHAHLAFSPLSNKLNQFTRDGNSNPTPDSSINIDQKGLLRLARTTEPLLIYRHRKGMSQSSKTPRKLLLQLRVKAFEDTILSDCNRDEKDPKKCIWDKFVIWGAGRDGKDFLKALNPTYQKRVICFVDVDWKKIDKTKFYVNKEINIKIPILHFSDLAKDPKVRQCWSTKRQLQKSGSEEEMLQPNSLPFGAITKEKGDAKFNHFIHSIENARNSHITQPENENMNKTLVRTEVNVEEKMIDSVRLIDVPVVVCVSMYRTNGVLENNVASIERKEGYDLWHFS